MCSQKPTCSEFNGPLRYDVLQGLIRALFLLAFLTVVRVFVRSRADTALQVLAAFANSLECSSGNGLDPV